MTPTLGAAMQQDPSPNKVEIKAISIKNQWDPSQIQIKIEQAEIQNKLDPQPVKATTPLQD